MPRRNLIILAVAALVSFLCYRQAVRNHYGATLAEALAVVDQHYIDEVEPRVLFEGAMNGMIDQLDPNSGYTPPSDFKQFNEAMDGEFGGIGIVVEADPDTSRLTVLSPLVGTPAYKAGLKSGDIILEIDGQDTKDMPVAESARLIRGKIGTLVKLQIQHAGVAEPVSYELSRAMIPIESVMGDARRADGTWVFRLVDHPLIGYIRVDKFAERTANELQAAFDSYRQPGEAIDGLILDLRGNAGGLLESAVATCDLLLEDGVIVTTRGRGGVIRKEEKATAGVGLPSDLPLVVLIDKFSASASEIVAACLQDNHRALVVGQRSWGKGTVQNVISLEGGRSAMRLTIGSYWRPSGKDIHKRKDAKDTDDWGVRPDPGQEVHLTNQEYETVVLARRRRDVTGYQAIVEAKNSQTPEDVESRAPSAPSPAPLEEPDERIGEPAPPGSESDAQANPQAPPVPTIDPDSETSPAALADQKASANALRDPATIDAQLRQAIQCLQEEIARRQKQPRKA